MKQIEHSRALPDTIIFDLEESRKGYHINKMCDTLRHSENRDAFKADEEAYMDNHGLTEEEKALVRARDWAGLTEAGGNIYYLLKLGFVVKHGLYRMGAQMRGEDFETFLATRNGQGAR